MLYRTIDHKTDWYYSTPKTASGTRTIPLIASVRSELLELRNKKEPVVTIAGRSDYIFRNKYGRLLIPVRINHEINRIVEIYNSSLENCTIDAIDNYTILEHFSVHTLRHTFCTRLCECEPNVKVIQKIMGHEHYSITMDIYAEVESERLNRMLEMSNQILPE